MSSPCRPAIVRTGVVLTTVVILQLLLGGLSVRAEEHAPQSSEKKGYHSLKTRVARLIAKMNEEKLGASEAALRELIRIGKPAVPTLLIFLDKEDGKHRSHVCDALWRIGDKRALPKLRGILKDASASDRGAVANALSRIGDLSVLDLLLAHAYDRNEFVRMSVADGLAYSKNPQAVTDLCGLFWDASPLVRFSALLSLEELKDRRSVPTLLSACRRPGVSILRIVVNLLGDMGDKRALPVFKELMDEDHPIEIQILAAFNLVKMTQDPDAFAFLIQAVDRGDEDAVEVAATCLGRLRAVRAVPVLRVVLGRGTETERAAAAQALVHIGSKAAESALRLSFKKDEYDQVRIWCAAGLVKMSRDKKALDTLLEFLRHEDCIRRKYALMALCEVSGKAELASIMPLLKDEYFECRGYAVEALGRIGGSKAISALIDSLQDLEWGVRAKALKALSKLTGKLLGANYWDWKTWAENKD